MMRTSSMPAVILTVILASAAMVSAALADDSSTEAASLGDTFSVSNADGVMIKYKIQSLPNGNTHGKVQVGDGSEASVGSAVTSVTIPATVNDGSSGIYDVANIGANAFYDCTNLTNVIIPSGVAAIGDSAFAICSSLRSINIPNGVVTIGLNAFDQCRNLTGINFPNSLVMIGSNAFYECSGLTSITIPRSVIFIGDSAFSDCTGLSSVTFEKTTRPNMDGAFYKLSANGTVYYPGGAESAYNNILTYMELGSGWASKAYHVLTIQAGSGGVIEVGGSGNYAQNDVINITASANSGYVFRGWSSSAGGTFADASRISTTFTMPNNAATVTANFTESITSVTGISLDRTELILAVGEGYTLIVTITPADATNKGVTWSSSDAAVASVDANGRVTAVGAGMAAITARSDNGLTASCVATVRHVMYPV
ncbi:MAG: leucine-rich repeat protein, partial [Candidatus Methanoplasma sp.]|nr:leucine-rich repeat protein [Candidatus Methanoplasma sp.]